MPTVTCRRCGRQADTLRVILDGDRARLVCPICYEQVTEEAPLSEIGIDTGRLAFLVYLVKTGRVSEGLAAGVA